MSYIFLFQTIQWCELIHFSLCSSFSLSELENRLITLIPNIRKQSGVSNLSTAGVSLPSQWSAERNGIQFSEGDDDAGRRTKRKSQDSIQSQQDLEDAKLGQRRKKAKDNLDISVYACAPSEAHAGKRMFVSHVF